MKVTSVEKKEKSTVELTIQVEAEAFEAALQRAYLKNRKSMNVPGFRKGKAPRKMVEKMYGAEIFFDDAISLAYPDAYEAALKETGLKPVAYPQLEVLDVSADGFTFKATVTVKPEVSIKDYKGLPVGKADVKVSAADIKAELKPYIDRASRLVSVDRKAKKGDTAVIDFEGFKDGVPFQGGKGESYSLELGSGSFVPGFEEQVIGMKAGDEKDLDITFPENYTPELAGAAVVFKVKVHEVKEKQEPEVDDEFAKDVSEFDTLEEFKKDLGEKLKTRRQEQADRDFETAVIDALIEKLECDVPQAMIDHRADKMLEDYANRIQGQGIGFENYLQMMGMTLDELRAQSKTAAERNVRSDLALEAVAAAEGIEATDADVDEEIAKLAEQYKLEADKVRELVSMEDLRTDLAMRKALDLVKGAAKKPAKKAKKADGAEGEEDEPEEKPAKKKTASKGKGKAASDSEEN